MPELQFGIKTSKWCTNQGETMVTCWHKRILYWNSPDLTRYHICSGCSRYVKHDPLNKKKFIIVEDFIVSAQVIYAIVDGVQRKEEGFGEYVL